MKKLLAVCLLTMLIGTGCSEQRANKYNIDLPPGQKLVDITWKDGRTWHLTRPMRSNESPEVYKFQKSAPYAPFEGEITITEHATTE